jgi:integrase
MLVSIWVRGFPTHHYYRTIGNFGEDWGRLGNPEEGKWAKFFGPLLAHQKSGGVDVATKQEWERVGGLAGLQAREYDEGTVYRFRQLVGGKPHIDFLGLISVERAVVIVSTLKENRKLGTGPQTYKEMEESANLIKKAEMIQVEAERKRLIKEDEFAKSNTIETFWKNVYYPWRSSRPRLSQNVTKSISGVFENWIKPIVGKISLQELQRKHIEAMLQNMERQKKAVKTQKHAYSVLQAMWEYARQHFSDEYQIVLPLFPGKKVGRETLTLNNRKTCWLTREEATLLLDALRNVQKARKYKLGCDSLAAYGMAVLGLYSGLRFGDIASLTWGDVLDVTLGYARNPKGRQSYGIHIDIFIIQDMFKERRNMISGEPNAEDLVFPNSIGGIRTQPPREYFKVVEEIGLNEVPKRKNKTWEKIDFHALRHTFATWLAQDGVSQHTIMGLMGHGSLSMTERYMAHSPEHSRIAVKRMAEGKERAALPGS